MRKVQVNWEEVGAESAGQRIDNFLAKILKGVPRSHIHRILRSGEVRVNSGRVDATYRIQSGDRVRIPPVRRSSAEIKPEGGASLSILLEPFIIYEDESFLALNKPSGWAVHGGSGVRRGVIEQLRAERPGARFLELVHRLDRDTSGILLVAKRRSILVALHELFRQHHLDKRYLAFVKGELAENRLVVSASLHKFHTAGGERRVMVSDAGKESSTVLVSKALLAGATLVEARLQTGRTHQIRVHLSHLGHPIAGDDKYGDFEWNRQNARRGLKRLFLHASLLRFTHPESGEKLVLKAELPPELASFLEKWSATGDDLLPETEKVQESP